MAQPGTEMIEAVYTRAEAAGLTRAEADQAATPALGAALGGRPITTLSGAISGADLRRAGHLIDEEIRSRRPAAPRKAGPALERDVYWALDRRRRAGLPPPAGWEHLYMKASGNPNGNKIAAARLTADQAREIVAAAKAGA